MTTLAIAGATGRTGRSVLELAVKDARFQVAAALTAPGDPKVGAAVGVDGCDLNITTELAGPCDVLIDFTVPDGTARLLDQCIRFKVPMVIGTTGHSKTGSERIAQASQKIAIVKATNFSIGVYELLNLVGRIARDLGPGFDIEIVESHHRHKVDAPSGTALSIVEALLSATGRSREDVVYGRQGTTGARPTSQIGVHALRMGEVVGHHAVHFSSGGETFVIQHTAHSRQAFAAGALRAAEWIVGKGAGLYGMKEVMENCGE